MNNDEILKHIKEMLNSDCFADCPTVQKFINNVSESTPNVIDEIYEFFISLFDSIVYIVDSLVEQLCNIIDECIDFYKSTQKVDYISIYSRKIKVQPLKCKRLWKRQKIP